MSRNFPNFLTAYENYARDNFVPDLFHKWVGLSILAAAVERKITLKQGRVHHVPNIYTMLVSHPAVGKSTAIHAGTHLIEVMKKEYRKNFRIIPNQITEPAFIDMMKIVDRFPLPTNPNISLPQSAGFFYASEASSSALKMNFGDFIAALTDMYDCPQWFRKKLKGDDKPTEIENSCMNILVGTTFHELSKIVNQETVMGGFASRVIYVVSKERKIRETRWGDVQDFNSSIADKLIQDLTHINSLIGPMKPTDEWISKWQIFQPKFDRYLINLKNPGLESLMARKGTNLIKISMLLSLAESDSLVIEGRHFDEAEELINTVYKDCEDILLQAVLSHKDSQAGINAAVMSFLASRGGSTTLPELRKFLFVNGNPFNMIDGTVDLMSKARIIHIDGDGKVTLLNEEISD